MARYINKNYIVLILDLGGNKIKFLNVLNLFFSLGNLNQKSFIKVF